MRGLEMVRGIGRVRCYDYGPGTVDRYTIIFEDIDSGEVDRYAIGASAHPLHPQGIGQHTTAHPGPHLGKRVPFASLPPDVQRMVMLEAN